jgi:hypothetical protein
VSVSANLRHTGKRALLLIEMLRVWAFFRGGSSPGDSGALAEAMASWINNPGALRRFGMEALSRVRRRTHRAMHAERSQIIACHFNPSSTSESSRTSTRR